MSKLKIEPDGRYRNLKDDGASWKWINLSFKGNPLLSALSQEQLAQLQVEYRAEIEKLVTTNKGVWEDTTIFFVRAQK